MSDQENRNAALFVFGLIFFLLFFALISNIMFNMRAIEVISNL